ncbi:MAG TPA: cobyric acid synthase [Chloroflexota bacterium]|nr:cobyric acid synthase [Chloroflexota bacterium]
MTARVLMLQGTASSVGKSLLCAGICRLLRQDGYRVAPFKAQNMALNSFATPEGLEIGRAQAVQAAAAGIPPHVDMNPILLKPEADSRSQVVLMGRPAGSMSARDYFRRKLDLWPTVCAALDRLRQGYEVVVIEGAGSPAEVNLREREIVNMRVARHAGAPVFLVGDIDRGGVMAALGGTLALLLPAERALVKGLIVNRFRGDVTLFRDGVSFLEQHTGLPVLGVVPYVPGLRIADEDSVALESRPLGAPAPGAAVDVAVIRLPHIANFDDFAPLEAEPGVGLRYVEEASDLGWPEIVVLPGTKTTIADLEWLRRARLAERILGLAAAGSAVLGICGGYQMLGRRLRDPQGVETPGGADVPGLGLLPVETVFLPRKATRQVQGSVAAQEGPLAGARGAAVTAYEIHMGETTPLPDAPSPPFFILEDGRPDGTLAPGGRVAGTYLHGAFQCQPLRRALLTWGAARNGKDLDTPGTPQSDAEAEYDRLAAVLRQALDVPLLYQIAGLTP